MLYFSDLKHLAQSKVHIWFKLKSEALSPFGGNKNKHWFLFLIEAASIIHKCKLLNNYVF